MFGKVKINKMYRCNLREAGFIERAQLGIAIPVRLFLFCNYFSTTANVFTVNPKKPGPGYYIVPYHSTVFVFTYLEM